MESLGSAGTVSGSARISVEAGCRPLQGALTRIPLRPVRSSAMALAWSQDPPSLLVKLLESCKQLPSLEGWPTC